MIRAFNLIAWAVMGAAPQSSPVPQDSVPFARAFLEAFTANPQSTKKLVTSDALFVFIDIGGPYAELLKAAGTKKPAIAACALETLRQTRTLTMDELKDTPAASFRTPGRFAVVEGVYACKRADGSKAFVDVMMILKNNLVAEFGIVPRRT